MIIVHLFGWLTIVLVAWGALSIFVTPLIGQFLAGALHEPNKRATGSRSPQSRYNPILDFGAKLASPAVQPECAPNSDFEVRQPERLVQFRTPESTQP